MRSTALSDLYWSLPYRWRIRLLTASDWVRPSYVWYRLVWGPIAERYYRLMFWLHRGVSGEWWCPATNEVVTTCANRRGVVVSVNLAMRDAQVRYADGQLDTCSWTHCLEPGDITAVER